MMMVLGMFVFSLPTLAYQELQRQTQWKFASNARVGRRDALQYTGKGDDSITLTGWIAPELTGTAFSLDALRLMADTGKSWFLIQGTGRIYGSFVIESMDVPTREAMDLAYLTGGRPADLLKIDETHLRDGDIEVRQNKTGHKLRIAIKGELATLIERIRTRKRSLAGVVVSTRLLVNEEGQPLGKYALRFRFETARAAAGIEGDDFQFRDLRAKAATDKTDKTRDIRKAQQQLGHTSVTMTESYVRKRRGQKVMPTK